MKIGSRYAALPDTGRSPEEILGYDGARTAHVIVVDSSAVIAIFRQEHDADILPPDCDR